MAGSPNQRPRSSWSTCDYLVRGNMALVGMLTIASTALTACLIRSIASTPLQRSLSANQTSAARLVWPHPAPSTSATVSSADWAQQAASEMRPFITSAAASTAANQDLNATLSEAQREFKRKLATLSKQDLLRLLRIVQDRLDRSAAARIGGTAFDSDDAIQPAASERARNLPPVVKRSVKMGQLMASLEKLESTAPKLDPGKLDRLATLDAEHSLVRVLKPDTMNAVLDNQSALAGSGAQSGELSRIARELTPWRDPVVALSPPRDDNGDPDDDQQHGGWSPQQPDNTEPIEDWPTEAPSKKPQKRKRKKFFSNLVSSTTSTTSTTTTSTTSTTTTTTPAPIEIVSTAAPVSFEEVWIEEQEEELYRPPPRRKSKKYKKKSSPVTAAPVAPTSTTRPPATSTTGVPVVSSSIAPTTEPPAQLHEDWPEDEMWPESEPAHKPGHMMKQGKIEQSTESDQFDAHGLFEQLSKPDKGPDKQLGTTDQQNQEQQKQHKQQQQKQQHQQPHQQKEQQWPEEDWLEAVKQDVEQRLQLVYDG